MLIAGTGPTPNNYLYSGERFDSNLSLYHLRARYFNPATGRFETTAPYAGSILNPGTLHKYAYARNNPVNRIDPTGRVDILENALALNEVNDVKEHAGFQQRLQNATPCP
jgi:RHS repeat-associated protein